MKHLFFSFVFMLISSFAFANTTPDEQSTFYGKITITETIGNQKSEINLVFRDSNSFNDFSSQQLDALKPIDKCIASVEVTVSVSLGVVSVSATVKADGIPCEEVAEKIKELKQEALDAIR